MSGEEAMTQHLEKQQFCWRLRCTAFRAVSQERSRIRRKQTCLSPQVLGHRLLILTAWCPAILLLGLFNYCLIC